MDIRKLKLTAEMLVNIFDTYTLLVISQHKPTDEKSAKEWAQLFYTHMSLYIDEPEYRKKVHRLLAQAEAHTNANLANKDLSLEELISLNDFPEDMDEN